MIAMPRFLARLLTRVPSLFRRAEQAVDAWERIAADVEPSRFGAASRHDFRWYFEGESAVRIDSVDALCDWLQACDYCADHALFNERDYWQHPRTFEQVRKGDCEDFALWAWRKLVELGYDAEFVCGQCDPSRPDGGYHAWVIFRHEGQEFVLEAASRARGSMVLPLTAARERYRPHFAVDRAFRTTGFGGYLLSERARRQGRQRGS